MISPMSSAFPQVTLFVTALRLMVSPWGPSLIFYALMYFIAFTTLNTQESRL